MDRSVLETKAVTELKEIAKSLDLKVSGLKKAQIIDAIAKGRNGSSGGAARDNGGEGSSAGSPRKDRGSPPPA